MFEQVQVDRNYDVSVPGFGTTGVMMNLETKRRDYAPCSVIGCNEVSANLVREYKIKFSEKFKSNAQYSAPGIATTCLDYSHQRGRESRSGNLPLRILKLSRNLFLKASA